jgi:polyisoprenoid-binding protein YceI
MVPRRLIRTAAALCLALPVGAAAMTLHLDPAKTTVQFTFGATLHTVHGTLRAKEGTVRFEQSTGPAEGWVVLDATSAETGNARRDRKMHEKILESRRFPDITFNVERISGSVAPGGRSEIQLHGILDWHGTRRPIDLPASVIVKGDQVTATGFLNLPYLEWGLTDPSFFLLRVAKEVRIEIKAVGRLSE